MSQASKPKVFVIVLNWNGWRDTTECLESLQQLDYSNFRIVVVDNDSSNDSLYRIKRWANGGELVESHYVAHRRDNKPLTVASYTRDEAEAGGTVAGEAALSGAPSGRALVLIQSGANRGFAGGSNIGIRYALERGAEYVWLLNNDTLVNPGALSAMVRRFEEEPDLGLVGSVQYHADDGEMQAYGGGRVRLWAGVSRYFTEPVPDERLHYVTGTSMLIKREVLEGVGLLNDSYFMYWEDTEYGFKVREAGWKLAVAQDSRILHKEAAALGKKSPMLDAYYNASTVRFFKGRHPSLVPILVAIGGRLTKRLVKGEWQRAKAVWRGAKKGWTQG